MGTSKALLEWHGSTLVRHTVDLVSAMVGGLVIVVRRPGQALPPLPPDVQIVDDAVPGTGPLDAHQKRLLQTIGYTAVQVSHAELDGA